MLVPYFALRTPEPRNDFERFQGTWALTTEGREKQFPITVRVSGDRWVYLLGDKEQKKYRLTLRPETDPKELDLTQLGADDQPTAFVLHGVYTIERDRAKVVTAPGNEPRPTGFDAPDRAPVWILERQE